MAERSQTAPEAGRWGRSIGEALRLHGCPGPEGTADLGMALLLRRPLLCLRGRAMTSRSGVKGGAYPSEWRAGTSESRRRRGV